MDPSALLTHRMPACRKGRAEPGGYAAECASHVMLAGWKKSRRAAAAGVTPHGGGQLQRRELINGRGAWMVRSHCWPVLGAGLNNDETAAGGTVGGAEVGASGAGTLPRLAVTLQAGDDTGGGPGVDEGRGVWCPGRCSPCACSSGSTAQQGPCVLPQRSGAHHVSHSVQADTRMVASAGDEVCSAQAGRSRGLNAPASHLVH
jgi:hypothetical protein